MGSDKSAQLSVFIDIDDSSAVRWESGIIQLQKKPDWASQPISKRLQDEIAGHSDWEVTEISTVFQWGWQIYHLIKKKSSLINKIKKTIKWGQYYFKMSKTICQQNQKISLIKIFLNKFSKKSSIKN